MPLAFIYLLCLIPIGLTYLIMPETKGLLVILTKVCMIGIVFWAAIDIWHMISRKRVQKT